MPEQPPRGELSAAWRDALARFDRDLQTRGASANTRRAYGADLQQFGAWAAARGRASVRSLYTHLVAVDEVAQNPAELLPNPKRDSRLPRVLARGEVGTLLDRIPAGTPLEIRDRAVFELAHFCGL